MRRSCVTKPILLQRIDQLIHQLIHLIDHLLHLELIIAGRRAAGECVYDEEIGIESDIVSIAFGG